MTKASFTATSTYANEFQSFNGRLNGPFAWCPADLFVGQEYLQIHIPEAETVCAIALQGSGVEKAKEYVTEYFVKYSVDGEKWDEIKDGEGNLKV